MRLGPVLALATAALGAGAAAAAAGTPPGPPVTVRTSITNGPHLFGDFVRAKLDVLVDPTRVDPETVRLGSRFDPYTSALRPERAITASQGVSRVEVRYTLECLWIECLGSQSKPRRIAFRPSAVRYLTRAGRPQAVDARWPPFRLVYRTEIPPEQAPGSARGVLSAFTALRATTTPPEPDPGLSTSTLGSLVLSAAFLALLAAVVVAWPVVRLVRERLVAAAERQPLTPLEEALEHVEAAAADGAGGPAHREALALLARELRRTGQPDLVRVARRLAWSSAPPTRADSLELARSVREAVAQA